MVGQQGKVQVCKDAQKESVEKGFESAGDPIGSPLQQRVS